MLLCLAPRVVVLSYVIAIPPVRSFLPYEHKGVLGVPEKFDSIEKLNEKCGILAELIKNSKHVVVHTGAGISTSAGIPDFRGPNGVWTLEKQGKKPTINMSFADAKPTKTAPC